MENVLCIYHGNCADGFTAAWVLKKYFPYAEVFAATYGGNLPDVTGKHVFMLDFMYPMDTVFAIAQQAKSVLILDHHKSAMEQYNERVSCSEGKKGVVNFIRVDHSIGTWKEHVAAFEGPGDLAFVYADDMSGAGLAWGFFFPHRAVPKLVRHVQDRDLWLFELPHTREFQSYLFSFPYNFSHWSTIAERAENPALFALMVEQGAAIDRKAAKDIAELLSVCKRYMEIGGYSVPVASLPYTMVSDAAQAMAIEEGAPFAACYWDTSAGRVFGLRSPTGEVDVADIAKQYGGGGHKKAAGFTVSRDHPLAQG